MGLIMAAMVSIALAAAMPVETPDIIVERATHTLTYRSTDRSPEAIYRLLDDVCEKYSLVGDRVTLTTFCRSGRLDQLNLSYLAELRGLGPDKSGILMTSQYDALHDGAGKVLKPAGPSLLLPQNGAIRITSLRLQTIPDNPLEDGALSGWPGTWSGSSHVAYEDCELYGHDWGVTYDWCAKAKRVVEYRRCKIVGARTAVAFVSTSAQYNIYFSDCELGVDGRLSQSIGASSESDPNTGGMYCPILIKAGRCHVENCRFWTIGWQSSQGVPYSKSKKFGPLRMVTMATDQFHTGAAKTTRFTAVNSRVIHFDPGIATEVFDLDFRNGRAAVDNLRAIEAATNAPDATEQSISQARGGTGPDGELRVWQPVLPTVKETR